MRFSLVTPLVASVFAFFGHGLCQAETTSSQAIVWKLDNLNKLGGEPLTVLGTPTLVKESFGQVVHFDGVADGFFVPINPIAGMKEFTIEVLFKPKTGGLEEQRFFHIQDVSENRGLLEIRLLGTQWALDSFLYTAKPESRCALLDKTKLHPANQWTWVALVYSHGHMSHYINGAKELEGDVNFAPSGQGQTSLGVRQNKVFWFKGSIAEARFYSQALPSDKLEARTTGPDVATK